MIFLSMVWFSLEGAPALWTLSAMTLLFLRTAALRFKWVED